MTKSSPVHPSSDVTLARLAKLLVVTLLLLSPVYATALIVYGEKTNSFRVISPARKLVILLGPERNLWTKTSRFSSDTIAVTYL